MKFPVQMGVTYKLLIFIFWTFGQQLFVEISQLHYESVEGKKSQPRKLHNGIYSYQVFDCLEYMVFFYRTFVIHVLLVNYYLIKSQQIIL